MNSYWLNIYKPTGISSAKLVSIVKKLLGKVKVGHSGTLDVEAEGVLPLAIGEATKLVQMLIDAKKTYIFTVKFGTQTDSGDYAGKVIASTDYIPSKESAYAICSKFIGNVKQTPPAFSALKVNGVRAYKLAREGKQVELKQRDITIYDLKCLNYDERNATATYYAECSKGTYIRTLAEDLALSLQSLGFVIQLRRTQVGIFKEENAIRINYAADTSKVESQINGDPAQRILREHRQIPKFDVPNLEVSKVYPDEINKISLEEKKIKIEAILDDILVLDANDEQAQKIRYGQKCSFNYEKDASLVWIRHKGVLLAIGSLDKSCFNSLRVFNLTQL